MRFGLLALISVVQAVPQRPKNWSSGILKNHETEPLALMNEAYEEEKLSRTQVYFWYKRFKDFKEHRR
ncbi:hypothetical protein LAZ67_8001169 [Cordylochernes scorpioides]|uniref:Mos1 transposase HTH domain-containing protein n=1 Tax=Cordylochernes scorpioides TaxID=51811 RepID=A0ABY6KQ25_9ARAC|nr:hypothetical protein LAZ67_8001169 [Cordylochernes scorpioides]